MGSRTTGLAAAEGRAAERWKKARAEARCIRPTQKGTRTISHQVIETGTEEECAGHKGKGWVAGGGATVEMPQKPTYPRLSCTGPMESRGQFA